MIEPPPRPEAASPTWGRTTKMVVGITLVAVLGILFAQVRMVLTPLVMALILAYLLHPLVNWLDKGTRLSWRGAVNVIFIILLILLLGTLTASVLAIANQLESLVGIVEDFITGLPQMVEEFTTTTQVIVVPLINYEIDLSQYISRFQVDLLAFSEQILSTLQPVLGEAGSFLGKVAGSVFGILGWAGFIIAVAYLTLGEARQDRRFLVDELPTLTYDLERMGRELGLIWNTFLRGQVMIFFLVSIAIFILMNILGVRYALGLAVLAGLAKFLPYVGPFIAAVANALVAIFQPGGNYFGLAPFWFGVVVVIAAIAVDQVFDSVVIPRIFSSTLGVHPAAVLVVAIVATSWIGLLGLVLAAPLLASGQLILRYVIRKMLDQDPWPIPEEDIRKRQTPFQKVFQPIWNILLRGFARFKKVIRPVWDALKRWFSRIKERFVKDSKNE